MDQSGPMENTKAGGKGGGGAPSVVVLRGAGAAGEWTEEIFHLVKRCRCCWAKKFDIRYCFSKEHAQGVKTVRASRDGKSYQCARAGNVVRNNVIFSPSKMWLKPGSRVLARNINGVSSEQVTEVAWEDVAGVRSISLAPGTVLQHSNGTPIWIHHPEQVVEDYVIPAHGDDTYASSRQAADDVLVRMAPEWARVKDDDYVDDGERAAGQGQGRKGESVEDAAVSEVEGPPSRKRRSSVAGAGKGNGSLKARAPAEEEVQGERQGGAAGKRRKSTRLGAGLRVSPVGSGGRLGETDAEATGAGDGPPAMSNLATKEEVQKREAELHGVIARANAELEENNERRRAAVTESEGQLLSIIDQREAKAAYWDELAAQARAENESDKLSLLALLAHKEQAGGRGTAAVLMDAGLSTVGGHETQASGAAAAGTEAAVHMHQAAQVSPRAGLSTVGGHERQVSGAAAAGTEAAVHMHQAAQVWYPSGKRYQQA